MESEPLRCKHGQVEAEVYSIARRNLVRGGIRDEMSFKWVICSIGFAARGECASFYSKEQWQLIMVDIDFTSRGADFAVRVHPMYIYCISRETSSNITYRIVYLSAHF